MTTDNPDHPFAERGCETFHVMISNPPFGVDWKQQQAAVAAEHRLGDRGRFAAGLPRVSDGQLLFVQHIVSKMDAAGGRAAIVMSGSPLFTGGAGSGESEIRRWLIEQDLVEAIVGLPTELFPSTGIQTFIWVLLNRKPSNRAGIIHLIDASGEAFWSPMRKAVGLKRREIPDQALEEIVRLCSDAVEGDVSKSLLGSAFGYREIRVERPLRLNFQGSADRLARLAKEKAFQKLSDCERAEIEAVLVGVGDAIYRNRDAFERDLTRAMKSQGVKVAAPIKKAILSALSERDREADVCIGVDGKPEPDTELRDCELLAVDQDIDDYMAREVLPHVPDAWVDETYRDEKDGEVGRVGTEINFNRFFYRYVPPRPLHEIDADLAALEGEIAALMKEIRASWCGFGLGEALSAGE